ncbi:hypothetical protein [Marivita cryptomonadis]|uniref:hypothetical protein n=1 Tax=Marivita cryptomonadis TaxID=505252 RepID=UPI00391A866F
MAGSAAVDDPAGRADREWSDHRAGAVVSGQVPSASGRTQPILARGMMRTRWARWSSLRGGWPIEDILAAEAAIAEATLAR